MAFEEVVVGRSLRGAIGVDVPFFNPRESRRFIANLHEADLERGSAALA
jgi:hypothetical protein